MSVVVTYSDTVRVVQAWLATTSVAPLVQLPSGPPAIYIAMPLSNPDKAVTLRLIAGRPDSRKDLPQQTDRVQFDCWAMTHDDASAIKLALVSELESLARLGGFVAGLTYIGSAVVVSQRWLPDKDSDRPRYIVDALITTVT
ncbi:MAG: hypothetical protein ABW022_04910 [Actinoplanes sp.]